MKKSKSVTLIALVGLVAAVSCQSNTKEEWGDKTDPKKSKMYLRSDSTRPYTRGWAYNYFIFRSLGYLGNNGMYARSGYTSSAISKSSNSTVSRGGFGSSGFKVSS
jgi:hypothetical protein